MRQFCSVDTAQRDSGGAAIPMLYLFDTADDADEAEAEQYLSKLTAGEFSPLMYESKATARSEFAQFRQMFLLVGGILCAIIGLVGLLNFFNAMMTSILFRRREFAVLQAVGMTNRQLKTMLIYEDCFTQCPPYRRPLFCRWRWDLLQEKCWAVCSGSLSIDSPFCLSC